MESGVRFFTGTASKYLAERIAGAYGGQLGEQSVTRFSDGEFEPCYEETVRGHSVFIIQSTFPPSDNLMELLYLIDAAKRASAKQIVAVMPYFGVARQDRKSKPRVSIGSKLVANLLTAAGVTRIMTMDLHADQIQGFFDIPVDHLYASSIFIPYINKLNSGNIIFATPDVGGSKRANAYSKHFDTGMAICYKQREEANKVSRMTVIGDVEGKDVILVDDIVDTAGTLTKAANLMMENGAKSVRAMVTHPVLSGNAYKNINESKLTELVTTDTIPLKEGEDTSKITVLSVDKLFADVIDRLMHHESISSHFIF